MSFWTLVLSMLAGGAAGIAFGLTLGLIFVRKGWM